MSRAGGRRLEAPWTDEQVRALNHYQTSGAHPYTCWGEDGCRRRLRTTDPDNERALVATREGWVCPTCDRVQTWAWESSLGLVDVLTEGPMTDLGDLKGIPG